MAVQYTDPTNCQHWLPAEYKIIDGQPLRFRDVCVHEIRMGDVEDPDLFVADPIWKWEQTEEGRFIMEHAVDQPYWTRNVDPVNYGHVYRIVARLSEKNEMFWQLKWGNK
jgi:hypothetical protein